MLQLYCAPKTISVATVLTLLEGGVHFEPIRVDLAGGEQTRPDYHRINSKGRVPVLVTPEGSLTETGAILEYLAATAIPGMVPADPLHAARMREIMYYLASTAHVNHAHGRRGQRWADQESSWKDMAAKVPETMAASCAYLDPLIAGPYLFGDDLTLADPYLYTVCRWLEGDGVDVSRFPRIEAFMDAMQSRASVKQASAEGYFG
jgi:glutathione S-transferase